MVVDLMWVAVVQLITIIRLIMWKRNISLVRYLDSKYHKALYVCICMFIYLYFRVKRGSEHLSNQGKEQTTINSMTQCSEYQKKQLPWNSKAIAIKHESCSVDLRKRNSVWHSEPNVLNYIHTIIFSKIK